MADDGDGLGSAPWYVRFIVRIGVPTAFASILLWYLLTGVTTTLSSLEETQALMIKNQATIIENQRLLVELVAEHTASTTTTTMLLQALCINSAASETDRGRCVEAFGVVAPPMQAPRRLPR